MKMLKQYQILCAHDHFFIDCRYINNPMLGYKKEVRETWDDILPTFCMCCPLS